MQTKDFFPSHILAAEETLRKSIDHSIFEDPGFWESWVAIQLGGETTSHKSHFDVRVEIWRRICRCEVKFSNAFWASFAPIRGKDWSRYCFRWSITRAQLRRSLADAYVFIGLDVDKTIACWVIPSVFVSARNYTVCVPSQRKGGNGRLDPWRVCPGQLLPEFARVCHNKWDAEHRRQNAARTRREKSDQMDWIDDLKPGATDE